MSDTCGKEQNRLMTLAEDQGPDVQCADRDVVTVAISQPGLDVLF